MEYYYVVVLASFIITVAIMGIIMHDTMVMAQDTRNSLDKSMYDISMRQTCQELDDEIRSYDKYWIMKPSESVMKAYNDKGCDQP